MYNIFIIFIFCKKDEVGSRRVEPKKEEEELCKYPGCGWKGLISKAHNATSFQFHMDALLSNSITQANEISKYHSLIFFSLPLLL